MSYLTRGPERRAQKRLTRRRRAVTAGQVVGIMLILILGVAGLVFLNTVGSTGEISELQTHITSMQQKLDALQTGTITPPPSNQTTPTTRIVTLVAQEAQVQVASGVTYNAWTFNGTVPGPTIWANRGDTILFKLINDAPMAHSIDFHAAEVDWTTAYAVVPPGGTKTFNFTANYPGVFMYHCGTPPVLEHIGNGMYGAIIIRPSTPLAPAPGGEYVLVESEFYLNPQPNSDGTYSGNYTRMLSSSPNYVVFNGQANQYMSKPLLVQPNQMVRLYLLNTGPNLWEAFHVIGAVLDTVYIDGNPANVQHGLQTLSMPPSGGAIVEMYFRDAGGKNPFVNHAFNLASRGALGVFQVAGGSTATTTSTTSAATGVSVVIPDGAAANSSSASFSPPSIVVIIGMNNTVTWTNKDSAPHTVTAADKSFDSKNLNPGAAFTFTFTQPGTYSYTCLYHPWMKGKVIVMAMH